MKEKIEEKSVLSSHDIIKKYKEDSMKVNYPIGSKIIIRSNQEDEPYEIGTIKEYVYITKDNNMVPIIKINSEEYFAMGIMRHYSETLCKILDKLTPKEQWNILSEFNPYE